MNSEFGCKYHDDCFTCPFPDCIKGTTGSSIYVKLLNRKVKARELKAQGLKNEEIAQRLGVNKRTIIRDTKS